MSSTNISNNNNNVDSIVNEKNYEKKLEEIFKEIVEKNDIGIPIETLDYLINKELDLNLVNFNYSHLVALPYMLATYMKQWPGWEKKIDYINNELEYDVWYQKFKEYLIYKMNFLLTKTLPNIDKEIVKENHVIDKTSNVILSNQESFSNFGIEVVGPPSLTSSLVFWPCQDNVIVEQCTSKTWKGLNIDQLLNYPYVEVEFNSPELSFKRSFDPKITRFLSKFTEKVSQKSKFILGKHRINSDSMKFSFPLNLLETYIEVYKKNMLPQIPKEEKNEFKKILDHFYKDMASVATGNTVIDNRQISFNIGKNTFTRSKKILRDDDDVNKPDVVYNEIFVPKIVSSLRYFSGMQEVDMNGKRILSTTLTSSKMMMNFRPIISYRCTFCKLNFNENNSIQKMLRHLEVEHQRDLALMCHLCNKSSDITELAQHRWKCACQN